MFARIGGKRGNRRINHNRASRPKPLRYLLQCDHFDRVRLVDRFICQSAVTNECKSAFCRQCDEQMVRPAGRGTGIAFLQPLGGFGRDGGHRRDTDNLAADGRMEHAHQRRGDAQAGETAWALRKRRHPDVARRSPQPIEQVADRRKQRGAEGACRGETFGKSGINSLHAVAHPRDIDAVVSHRGFDRKKNVAHGCYLIASRGRKPRRSEASLHHPGQKRTGAPGNRSARKITE